MAFFLNSVPSDKPINRHESLRHPKHETHITYFPYPTREAVAAYDLLIPVDDHIFIKDTSLCLFIGQLPNIMPATHLVWFINAVLNRPAVSWLIPLSHQACAKVWLNNSDARAQLLALSKRVLFDVCGVWVANTSLGEDALKEYVAGIEWCDPRLPKWCTTIEVPRSEGVIQQPIPGRLPDELYYRLYNYLMKRCACWIKEGDGTKYFLQLFILFCRAYKARLWPFLPSGIEIFK